jgi:DUF4097 and DUF4098 domain-containing protein YvlB
MAMFVATLSNAAWNGYTEDRDLELDTTGISSFEIDAGAGSLEITGVDDLDAIQVRATINVPDKDADEANELIAEDLKLSLEKVRDQARLVAHFDNHSWSFDDSPSVDLDVRVPHGLALLVDDGSGSISVINVNSDISIDDGSGSIKIEKVGSIVIDDGSGSIKIAGVLGDVSVEDGSGSITVEHVGGSVTIDDGSGGIDVLDVEHDLIIIDDGSGSVSATDVRGKFEQDT